MFSNFGNTYFLGTPPSGYFSLYMSEYYTQKTDNNVKIIYDCIKFQINLL